VWIDVPFVQQEKNACGAAAVSMLMQYWTRHGSPSHGDAADQLQIQQALYSPDARGIYASAIENYLREHGFETFVLRGSWDDLHDHLVKGRPLMVALQPSGRDVPLHYVVVAGIGPGEVLLNDPARRKLLKQDQASFTREWKAAGNWTLLVVPGAGAR